MSNNYDAVFDAILTAFSGASHAVACIQQEISFSAAQYATPSAIYRPALSIDGDHWCALYGDNLQDGVSGFGKSPAEAMADFDKNWLEKLKGSQS